MLTSKEKPSSETQGQIKGARESLNGRKNIYGTKKSKERREEPLGTMSYQTSSKRSPPFWLLIGARKTQVFWHQSEARPAATVWNWSGKTSSPAALLAVLYFSSRHIFFRPFRLFLVPTICPWVSEDEEKQKTFHTYLLYPLAMMLKLTETGVSSGTGVNRRHSGSNLRLGAKSSPLRVRVR